MANESRRGSHEELGLDRLAQRLVDSSARGALGDDPLVKDIANSVVQSVAEMDDRTSPDDQPEMLLVTGEELHTHILLAFENWAERVIGGKAVRIRGGFATPPCGLNPCRCGRGCLRATPETRGCPGDGCRGCQYCRVPADAPAEKSGDGL